MKWLAMEPSVYGSYLNLNEPTADVPDETQTPPGIPGFEYVQGERISGWGRGFRLGLKMLVR